jgi:hypothetical protein
MEKKPCIGHYWPINGNVNDEITGNNASSREPSFKNDRFNSQNSAIYVSTDKKRWQSSSDYYFLGDTTITLWIKKLTCEETPIGIFLTFKKSIEIINF